MGRMTTLGGCPYKPTQAYYVGMVPKLWREKKPHFLRKWIKALEKGWASLIKVVPSHFEFGDECHPLKAVAPNEQRSIPNDIRLFYEKREI